jgi:hypothetical protein
VLALVGTMAASSPASADHDPTPVPKLLDVPPHHPWRHDTRLALSTAAALPGHSATAGHRLAEQNLIESSPPLLRRYITLGPVHGDRFTLTIVGDQACAIWPKGRPHRAAAGPCRTCDRLRLPQAAAATATVLGFLYDRSLHGVRSHHRRVQLISNLFSRATLANLAWTYAPRGVGVAGLIDHNHDGLDDDARVTIHGQGRAVCVRLGVQPREDSSYRPGFCKNLAHRNPHYPKGAGH